MVQSSILLADDHPIVRTGYRFLLETSGFLVTEVESAENAYKKFQIAPYDIVIMDISMPGMGGIEGVKRLIAHFPDVKILILSMYDDLIYQHNSSTIGAKGYLSKSCDPDEIINAVNRLLQGKTYFKSGTESNTKNSPELVNKSKTYNLSSRQFQIFRMLADGHSSMDISTELNLSLKTVNNHRSNIMNILKTEKQCGIKPICYSSRCY